jgi:MFS family permease
MVSSVGGGTILLPRVGPRPIVPAGMVLAGFGMILMSRITVAGNYAGQVLPALIITGLGMGLIFAASMNVATAGADPGDAGVASALPNVGQQVGGALGPALLNTIATSAALHFRPAVPMTPALAQASAAVHGDQVAFTVVYIIFFAAAVITAAILRSGKVQAPAGEMMPAMAA